MHIIKFVMPFLQLFVTNILIVLVNAELNYREPAVTISNITPFYYKLVLKPHIEEHGAFSGESRITIRIEKTMRTISFHSIVFIEEATLHKINPYTVTKREPYVGEYVVATYKPIEVAHFRDPGFVTLVFNETIECGYYGLEITFRDNLTKIDGFVVTSYENQNGELQWMVATQTRGRGPQAIFPCWDDPQFKTIFDISVFHRTSYMAFSTSEKRIVEYDVTNSDMTWTHFKSTPPISAHCIDIVVLPKLYNLFFDYTYYDINSASVTMWVPQNLTSSLHSEFDFAWFVVKEVTKYLQEQNLIDQCKMTETNYIALKNLSHAILPTPSFVLFREESINIFDDKYKYHKEMYVARLIAQKITYQWSLRSTNPLYWSPLNDVSNYLAMSILEEVLPGFTVAFRQIQSKYDYLYEITFQEYLYATTFNLDVGAVIKFIISTRTNTLCDSNGEELSLKSLFN